MPQAGEVKRGRQIGYHDGNEYVWQVCKSCDKERWVMLRNHKPTSLMCRSCSSKLKNANSGFRGIPGQLLTGQAKRDWITKNSQAKMGERNP